MTSVAQRQGLREAEAERSTHRESMRAVEDEVRGIRSARNSADDQIRRLEASKNQLRYHSRDQSSITTREAC
eukprot:1830681-Rhodomonas_salina.2